MKRFVLCLLALCLSLSVGEALAAKQFVRIGTSSVGGGFFLVGNTIAQLGQQKMPDCSFTAITGGSIKNLMNLEKKELELGISQSSSVIAGWTGTGTFKKPLKKLRYVTSIYPLPAHVMVSADSGVKSVADLKGKRIDYGPVGGGIEVNTREIMSVFALSDKDVKIERFGKAEFEESFRSGRIHGHIWASTTPNAQISDLIRTGAVALIALEQDKRDEIVNKFPVYIKTTIPAGAYSEYQEDIPTVGAIASLLTHDETPEKLIYEITKMLHENTDFLKERMNTYFAYFDLRFALQGKSEIPLHPGAEKYYREKGLLN